MPKYRVGHVTGSKQFILIGLLLIFSFFHLIKLKELKSLKIKTKTHFTNLENPIQIVNAFACTYEFGYDIENSI